MIEPALAAPTGIERLRQLAEGFLQHVEGDVFPGGCFFASVAAEMDTHPGPVRDLAVKVIEDWFGQLEDGPRDGPGRGRIDPAEDADQLTFELDAYLLLANAQFVISRIRRRSSGAGARSIAGWPKPHPAERPLLSDRSAIDDPGHRRRRRRDGHRARRPAPA